MKTELALPTGIKSIQVESFGENAGVLEQPAQYQFQYQQDNPVSLTMAVRDSAYQHGCLHPIFAQNLPEGFIRHYLYERLQRHANVNDLYLLALQGNKGIGHLAYRSDMPAPEHEQLSLDDIIHWQGKETIFPQLLEKFYLNGQLSGMQPKVLVDIAGRGVIHQQAYIVKTFDAEFEHLAANEFICMTAAKELGLNPPEFWLSDDLSCFVIERFDQKDGKKLAFEDLTVLMGKQGDHKYQSSYESVLKAVAYFTKSQQQIELAYKYIVFSCLIGNGDAHLKNFAIQYGQDRTNIELTPPYDITHTLMYPTLDGKMALKMANAKSFPDYKTLLQLGMKAKISKAAQIVEEMADGIQQYISSQMPTDLVPGLQESLYKSLAKGRVYTQHKSYRYDKKRKFN